MKRKILRLVRKLIYTTLRKIDLLFGRDNKLFILCYHSFSDDGWLHGVSFQQLEDQLTYLSNHYNPVTIDDILDVVNGTKEITKRSFCISIDDGYSDVFESRDIFKKLKISPIVFLLSKPESANRVELDNHKPFLTRNQILDLKKQGWFFGCHSATHPDMYNLTDAEIESEIVQSKSRLERYLGFEIKYFAYPKGRYNSQIIDNIKKAGYMLALSLNDSFISNKTNRFIVPRIGIVRTHTFSEFKSTFLPSVIYFRYIVKKLGVTV